MENRKKIINAIIYFAEHTQRLGKTKLFKLLYFLDVQHFREVGRIVTGLDYKALKMGPVPSNLYSELDSAMKADLGAAIALKKINDGRNPLNKVSQNAVLIIPKSKFDPTVFTPREIRILKETAEVYRDVGADLISEISHRKGGPWHQIFEVQKRVNQIIPFELALDVPGAKITREELDDIVVRDNLAKQISS